MIEFDSNDPDAYVPCPECAGKGEITMTQMSRCKEINLCDLCNDQAEYRQCQTCMNDKLVGSHTDEEWTQMEQAIQELGKLFHAAENKSLIDLWVALEGMSDQTKQLLED